jgi:LmbE family N-acetylglucosaminyl deacetylase
MPNDSRPPWKLAGGMPVPRNKRIAVMAPHPDDFDVVAVTLRRFADAGAEINVAVMTSGASGVDDADFPNLDRAAKGALRETEQSWSCAFFGLAAGHLHFLRLEEDEGGHLAENASNEERIGGCIAAWGPELVFLPHFHDPNLAHQRTYAMVRRGLEREDASVMMLLNRDPKTLSMRHDLYVGFGEREAKWKRELLRHHDSQQRRNLRTRGTGVDERVLSLNAQWGAAFPELGGYAEVFELRTAVADTVAEWPPTQRSSQTRDLTPHA